MQSYPSMMSGSELCRLVHLEWDRGHDEFDALVRAETAAGIVVTQLDDYATVEGLRWIRADEITSIEDLEDEHPMARFAKLRGWRRSVVAEAPTELPDLLHYLSHNASLVGVYKRRTGSDELLVGSIVQTDAMALHVTVVDSQAAFTGETETLLLDQIIGIDWGNSYLLGLAALLDTRKIPLRRD